MIDKYLAGGGFGSVFLADHLIEEGCERLRQVAIKLLPADPKNELGQMRELRKATEFEHANVIRCFDAGVWQPDEGRYLYLVMELADGRLSECLEAGNLSREEVLDVARSIAGALTYLHARPEHAVHGDIKPENVLRVGGRWKVSDFGNVRVLGAQTSVLTDHDALGTPGYAPPEAYDKTYSPAWDVWSLGVLLVVALKGTKMSPLSIQAAVCQTFDPSISEAIYAGLPEPFGDIVRGCLQKERHARWTSAKVLERLTRPVTSGHVFGLATPKRSSSKRIWFFAGAAAVIVIGAFGVSLAMRDTKTPNEAFPEPIYVRDPEQVRTILPCPAGASALYLEVTGTVSASSGVEKIDIADTENPRVAIRKDTPRDRGHPPVLWRLHLTPNRPDAIPAHSKTYYLNVIVATTRPGLVSLTGRVKALFSGEHTDILEIVSKAGPEYQLSTRGGNKQKYSHILDTNGYTSMLLASANLSSATVAPLMKVLLSISTTTGFSCFTATLPDYINDLESSTNSTLRFTPGGEISNPSNWEVLDGDKLARVPNASWGPPASRRQQEELTSDYKYYFRPRR